MTLSVNSSRSRYNLRSNVFNTLTSSDITEIIPNKLYLGNMNAASNLKLLRNLSITHVLNVTKDVDCHFPHLFSYLRIAINDGEIEIGQYFKESILFIKESQTIFVHCGQGISRSATIVIAYLMETKMWNFQKSYEFLKEKRPVIQPHFNFQVALINSNEKRILPKI